MVCLTSGLFARHVHSVFNSEATVETGASFSTHSKILLSVDLFIFIFKFLHISFIIFVFVY